MKTRIAIAVPGVLLGLFGIFRLLTQVPGSDLLELLVWLAAAVILHDGILAPVVVGLGWGLSHVVPSRGRRFTQGALIAGGLVTVVAWPLIHRQGTQPASKAILQQDYTRNLLIALAIIVAVALAGYLLAVLRDRRPRTTNVRPADDHDSTGS